MAADVYEKLCRLMIHLTWQGFEENLEQFYSEFENAQQVTKYMRGWNCDEWRSVWGDGSQSAGQFSAFLRHDRADVFGLGSASDQPTDFPVTRAVQQKWLTNIAQRVVDFCWLMPDHQDIHNQLPKPNNEHWTPPTLPPPPPTTAHQPPPPTIYRPIAPRAEPQPLPPPHQPATVLTPYTATIMNSSNSFFAPFQSQPFIRPAIHHYLPQSINQPIYQHPITPLPSTTPINSLNPFIPFPANTSAPIIYYTIHTATPNIPFH
ncbi:Hypp9570 [Branchiostoma lanceolatum]|uniref:Hypp9570 protein n=1 Tax=Branchiostoma lanceolatum TaxID=7740 RepID=A0A8S4MNH8_BRALA|nr:Hypp9570 [Branchiostoma lanceolatum]